MSTISTEGGQPDAEANLQAEDDTTTGALTDCDQYVEEIEYFVVEVEPEIDRATFAPGASLEFKGLDTASPTLALNNARVLKGAYAEYVGTTMVFEQQPDEDGKPSCKLVCMTDKKLKFKA